ncbi:MAG TPA: hypothetical protein VKB93_02035 [Thermoanaerobaculia bacterium]|nr:hypothetical protein [Thermoanaerobaculia bacterium]
MKAFLRANGPLLAVVAVVAVPILRVAAVQYIDYDGWWHIFVSRAESLRMFHQDWHKTTHPPTFFLLLKVFSFLGTSLLAYRAIPIVSGLVSVFLVGRIAERITASRTLGVLAAAAFGLSVPTLIVSCEVRSYTLAIAFVLVALDRYVSMIRLQSTTKDAVIFATATIGAIVSLYATALFLVAALLVPFFIAAVRADYRRSLLAHLRARKWILAAAFAAPAPVLAAAYVHHMWQWTRPLEYNPGLYFEPAADSWSSYLIRGVWKEFGLFSPVAIASQYALPLAIVLLVVAIAVLIVTLRAADVSVATPAVLFLAILSGIVILSYMGKFPFGGHLRHQFLLFPFMVLTIVSAASLFARRRMVVAVLAVLIAANALTGYRHYPIVRQPLYQEAVRKFRAVVPRADLLYLDEFSTMAFFSEHHSWRWHLAGADSIHTLHYDLTKDGRTMRLVRVRDHWTFNLFDAALYRELRRTMDSHRATVAGLFALGDIPAGTATEDVRPRMVQAAMGQRLGIDAVVVDGQNVYARVSALR